MKKNKVIPNQKHISGSSNYSKKKTGLPPGSLIYLGENRTSEVAIDMYNYDSTNFTKTTDALLPTSFITDVNTVYWVNIDAIHNVNKVQALGEYFNLHRLMLEDILDTSQRPKIEFYEEHLFLTLKMLRHSDEDKKVYVEQVSFVLGKNYVLSFQETKDDVFDSVRKRIESGTGQIRKKGADYLFYALLDTVVDHYLEVIEVYSQKVEHIEDETLLTPNKNTMHELQTLRKQLRYLSTTILPVKDALNKLEITNTGLIHKSTIKYFKDVQDHLLQCTDTLLHNKESLSNAANLYHGSLSTNMNNAMKVLTIISTIFIPLSFIAGVYGMNFNYMPELEMHYAYPIVIAVMITIGITMLVYFKNKKWL